MMLRTLKTRDNGVRALIALLMMCAVAIPIDRAELVPKYNALTVMLTAVVVGFTAGFFLAVSRFPTFTALIYSIVYGAFTVMWIVGRELPDDLIWRERVAELIAYQAEWVVKAYNGGISRENDLVFIIQTAFVMWGLGYGAAWSTIRRPRVWRVILPGGIVLLSVIHAYEEIGGTRPLALYLALYCILALIYLALTYLTLRKDDWLYKQVRFDNNITNNFLRGAAIIALVGMITAVLIPTFPSNNRVRNIIDSINEPWEQVQQEWQRVFSEVGGQRVSTAADPRRDHLTLGGERNPTDDLVMDVYTAEIPAAYWRSYIYDSYTDDGTWDVQFGDRTLIVADEDTPISRLTNQERTPIKQEFQVHVDDIATMYAAPDFSSGDRDINSYIDPITNEITHIRSRYIMDKGDRYSVFSDISTADEATLRRASINVPPLIADTYLQLPNGITERTTGLAQTLTNNLTNNYDKAKALETYLRNNIVYNDQISAPPNDVEVVDYFLFDLQEGYCNYYASAFTVMARSLGIPSRIASGYASGEYNPDTGSYRVRSRDAHTWPEVYFPDFGWIQFEPTVIISPPSRPSGEDPADQLTPTPAPTRTLDPALLGDLTPTPTPEPEIPADPADFDVPVEQDSTPLISRTTIIRIITAIVLIGLVIGAFTAARRINNAVEGDVEKSYGRLSLWARWIGVKFRPSNTPAERADMMSDAVPDGEQPINRLTREYARMQYSPYKKSSRRFNPLEEWRELRPLLFKSGFAKRLPNWLKNQK